MIADVSYSKLDRFFFLGGGGLVEGKADSKELSGALGILQLLYTIMSIALFLLGNGGLYRYLLRW